MRVSAKVDYALRALVELAASPEGAAIKGDELAKLQNIPVRFLENILGDLRSAGIVSSRRGSEGGYWLAKPADEVVVGEVIRVLEGPLANVQGVRPDSLEYEGHAKPLRDVWVATRARLREVLDHVTLAEIASGSLPDHVHEAMSLPGALDPR